MSRSRRPSSSSSSCWRRGRWAPPARRRAARAAARRSSPSAAPTRWCCWSTATPSTAAPSTPCGRSSAWAAPPTPWRAPRRKPCVANWCARRPSGWASSRTRPRSPPAARTWSSQLGGEEALTAALGRVPMTDDAAAQRPPRRRAARRRCRMPSTRTSPRRRSRLARTTTVTARRSARRPPPTSGASRWPRSGSRRTPLRRLREGRPFAEVARQFSSDPESKAEGGGHGGRGAVVAPGDVPQGGGERLRRAR